MPNEEEQGTTRRVKFLSKPTELDSGEQAASALALRRRVRIYSNSDLPAGRAPQNETSPEDAGIRVTPEIWYALASGTLVQFTLSGNVCDDLIRHCGESNIHGHEVGGMLVGYWCRRPAESGQIDYHAVVTDLIPLSGCETSGSRITFDACCWDVVDAEMRKSFAPDGKGRLGWWHTHPDQGIFFSQYDRDAHSIFRQPYQAALVVDPRSMDAGLFFWKDYGGEILGQSPHFRLEVAEAGDESRGTAASGHSRDEDPRIRRLRHLASGMSIVANAAMLVNFVSAVKWRPSASAPLIGLENRTPDYGLAQR